MRIGILGTGDVGRVLGAGFAARRYLGRCSGSCVFQDRLREQRFRASQEVTKLQS